MDRPAWDRGPGKAHKKLLDALAKALETRNCQLQHVKWFGAGRSDYPVASIIRYEDGPDHRILKFSTDEQQQRMEAALLGENAFVAQHLATVERERIPLGGNRCAVYMQIAGDDVDDLLSLEDLRARGRTVDYGSSSGRWLVNGTKVSRSRSTGPHDLWSPASSVDGVGQRSVGFVQHRTWTTSRRSPYWLARRAVRWSRACYWARRTVT